MTDPIGFQMQSSLRTAIQPNIDELNKIIAGLSKYFGLTSKSFNNYIAGLKEISQSLDNIISLFGESIADDPALEANSNANIYTSKVNEFNVTNDNASSTLPDTINTSDKEIRNFSNTQINDSLSLPLSLRNQNLCTEFSDLSTNNIFILPIDNIKCLIDQIKTKKCSKTIAFNFYTCYFGYRLNCLLSIDDTNVDIKVNVDTGEYDKMLAFPFNKELEIVIINLCDFSRSIIKTENVHKFPITLTQTKILTGNFTSVSEFIRNDTFYLQIRALNFDETGIITAEESRLSSVAPSCSNSLSTTTAYDDDLRADFPQLLKSNPIIIAVLNIQETIENVKYPTSFCPYQPIHKSFEFYTSHFGYRLNCNLQFTRDMIEVSFQILPGEYDDLLKWPFTKTLRVVLLDQLSRTNICDSETFWDSCHQQVFEFTSCSVERSELVEAINLKQVDSQSMILNILPVGSIFPNDKMLPCRYVRNNRFYLVIKTL